MAKAVSTAIIPLVREPVVNPALEFIGGTLKQSCCALCIQILIVSVFAFGRVW